MLYCYTFNNTVSIEEVEDTFQLARIACEVLYGEAEVLLRSHSHFDRDNRLCEIEANSQIGLDLNRLFVGLLLREFGSMQFSLNRGTRHQSQPV